MMEHTFSVIVFPKFSKKNLKDEAPLYGRIMIDGRRLEISMKHNVHINNWDSKKGLVKGKSEKATIVNNTIMYFLSKTKKLYYNEVEKGSIIDVEFIRDLVLGKSAEGKSLLVIFAEHNDRIKARIGNDFAAGTVAHYKTSYKHLSEYLHKSLKKSDIYLKELNYGFIYGFEDYLKTKLGNKQNSTIKHIQRLRKIVGFAIANEWILKDPFAKFTIKKEKTNRDFLTEMDLSTIENKYFPMKRIEEVRDCFIFSCYTGISYVDILNLEKNCLTKDRDGDTWIRTKRAKTGTHFSVLLLPKALEIIEKYSDHPKTVENNKLLPLISNQKINAYLKEIAIICNINTPITFHVARHTFATTITLTNGVPIETVSKMLGHASIKTTQIYGKIVEQKISDDMKNLRKRLITNTENQLIIANSL